MTTASIVNTVSGNNTVNSTSAVVTLPTNASGDVIYIAIADDRPASTFTTPSGYTAVRDNILNSTISYCWSLYKKTSGGSEPSTVTITKLSEIAAWIAFSVRDHGAINATGTDSDTDTTTLTLPAVTSTVNNCLIIRLGFVDKDTTPFGAISGYTQVESSFSSGTSVVLYYKVLATAGTEASVAVTMEIPEQAMGHSFAIEPTVDAAGRALGVLVPVNRSAHMAAIRRGRI